MSGQVHHCERDKRCGCNRCASRTRAGLTRGKIRDPGRHRDGPVVTPDPGSSEFGPNGPTPSAGTRAMMMREAYAFHMRSGKNGRLVFGLHARKPTKSHVLHRGRECMRAEPGTTTTGSGSCIEKNTACLGIRTLNSALRARYPCGSRVSVELAQERSLHSPGTLSTC